MVGLHLMMETEPPAVKCADCGFLSRLRQRGSEPEVAPRNLRMNGEHEQYELWCFEEQADLQAEVIAKLGTSVEGTDGVFRQSFAGNDSLARFSVLAEPRSCSGWRRYRVGFAPKEHAEFRDRELLIHREDRRDREMREREDTRDAKMTAREDRRDLEAHGRHRDSQDPGNDPSRRVPAADSRDSSRSRQGGPGRSGSRHGLLSKDGRSQLTLSERALL